MEISYEFKKTFCTEQELLKEFSLGRSYLYQIIKDWVDLGNDPIDMGKLPRMNVKNLWDPRVFLKWIYKNKIYKNQTKYHTEENQLKKVKSVVVSLNNKQREAVI